MANGKLNKECRYLVANEREMLTLNCPTYVCVYTHYAQNPAGPPLSLIQMTATKPGSGLPPVSMGKSIF